MSTTAAATRAVRNTFSGLPPAFWWLWASTLINRLGAFVSTFLALYLTVQKGYSASSAGLVAALYGLGGAAGNLVAGVLTDRLGRRPTLLASQMATAGTVALLGFASRPTTIAALAALAGMATSASRPAVQAMMTDLVPERRRVRAFALNYWAINLGFALSASAAGLIARYSYLWLFLGEALLTALCAVVAYFRLPETRPAGTGTPRPGPEPAGATSLWTVLRDVRFMTVVGLNLLLAMLYQQGLVALPLAMGRAGFDSTEFGVVIAANGVLIVALQMPVTRFIEHRSPGPLLVLSALLTGVGFGLGALADSVPFYVLTVCVWTLGEIVNSPTQMSLVARLSPVEGRGRYQGVYTLSWSVAAFAAPLLGGWVIDRFGASALWLGSLAVGILAALGYAHVMRRPWETPPSDAPAKTPDTVA
ncbi:MFS transporter [Streptomyces sp. Je 1-4]|uniref:MDR family MFS transporter n=1 Tax=Streptomyces TaxID=1883 RepID=UPI00140F0461|nr:MULTISPECIES: MFS transporter [unclassified Streptomyces]QIK04796.1 MFS transporter [Streptomyces sp. ID38640]UYB37936.1 MFS transporter [Streptomyces sp. Je 1-4]UZQ33864.1 MFS transporter [Streptomyces sp. Je 1-4] [Streptomyces sp. Je 1-4 4N24]UZQ41282.1 MFS transporter [Streptomyces sp. Je 1-4] [Streptomyces sp. Je 1-4 4N24_ara]